MHLGPCGVGHHGQKRESGAQLATVLCERAAIGEVVLGRRVVQGDAMGVVVEKHVEDALWRAVRQVAIDAVWSALRFRPEALVGK